MELAQEYSNVVQIKVVGVGGGGGNANVIECSQSQYDAWKAGGQLQRETTYIITDAVNLNGTANNLSFDGTSRTTKQAIDDNTSAIGDNTSNIGDLSALTTEETSSLVGAINEVNGTFDKRITLSVETGVTANALGSIRIGGGVLLAMTFIAAVTVNTWTKVGTLNVIPTQTVYAMGVYSQNGSYAGMIQVRTDGGIYYYPKIDTTAAAVGFTACFKTNS